MVENIERLNFEQSINNMSKTIDENPRVKSCVLTAAQELIKTSKIFLVQNDFIIKNLQNELKSCKEELLSIQNNNNIQNLNQTIPKSAATNSYANTLSKPPKKQSMKTILVKSKDELLKPNQIKEAICNAISSNEICCNQIILNKTNVAFKFPNDSSKSKFLNRIAANQILNQKIEAYTPTPKCPTIIIKNIDYSTPESELLNKIITQNNLSNLAKHIKILYIVKKRFYYNAVLCISPHIFDQIIHKNLYIGWSACPNEETFLLGHCSKCLSFQHKTKECQADTKMCRNCGLSFSTKKTINDNTSEFTQHVKNCTQLKCYHCLEKNLQTNHAALSPECPIFKNKIRQIKEKTCYDETTVVNFKNNNNNKEHPTLSSSLTPPQDNSNLIELDTNDTN